MVCIIQYQSATACLLERIGAAFNLILRRLLDAQVFDLDRLVRPFLIFLLAHFVILLFLYLMCPPAAPGPAPTMMSSSSPRPAGAPPVVRSAWSSAAGKSLRVAAWRSVFLLRVFVRQLHLMFVFLDHLFIT
jgi:hypothetical protein